MYYTTSYLKLLCSGFCMWFVWKWNDNPPVKNLLVPKCDTNICCSIQTVLCWIYKCHWLNLMWNMQNVIVFLTWIMARLIYYVSWMFAISFFITLLKQERMIQILFVKVINYLFGMHQFKRWINLEVLLNFQNWFINLHIELH